MIKDRTDKPPETPPSADQDLHAISEDFPGCVTWLGLSWPPVATHRKPQLVVRSPTIEGLRAEIERAEIGMR